MTPNTIKIVSIPMVGQSSEGGSSSRAEDKPLGGDETRPRFKPIKLPD
jgi:hypothetical protein